MKKRVQVGERAGGTRAAARPTKKRAKASKKPASMRRAAKHAAAAPSAPRARSRADLGAPVDEFFARQKGELGEILAELRRLIDEVVPDASSSIKWGMPFYALHGQMMCALGAHKAHVNLILSGPPGTFEDPDGLLSGESKLGRHMKLKRSDELPEEQVRGWLRTAAKLAAAKA